MTNGAAQAQAGRHRRRRLSYCKLAFSKAPEEREVSANPAAASDPVAKPHTLQPLEIPSATILNYSFYQ